MTSRAKSTSTLRSPRLPGQGRLGSNLGRLLGGLALVFLLWGGFLWSGQPVTVVVGEQSYPLRLHRLTVAAVLHELRLTPAPEDIITPPVGSRLVPNGTVTIQLARPVVVEADGQTLTWLTHQTGVGKVLAEAGIDLNARDEVRVNGVAAQIEDHLPEPNLPDSRPVDAAGLSLMERVPHQVIASSRPAPVHLALYRAIPVALDDDGVRSTFYTAQQTVREALSEHGLTIYEGDRVTPGLDTRLSPGRRIYIQRSIPVTILVDGRVVETRTLPKSVGELLAQEGIALMGQDFSQPEAGHALSPNELVRVTRVREFFEIEQEFIPFETSWVPDPEMVLDRQEVRQQGVTGVIKSRTRIRTENGQEVWRQVEDEWLDQEPSDRIIAYGTQVIVRTLETEAGPIEYWRKISMLATPYNAASSGKAADHPRYGITRSGLPAGFGIVAVDPKVIPLMTELYIPGYGRAVAGDTGGLIHGKRVDLGFDDGQPLPEIYEWRDVYILTPVPPADKIRYVLPEWPQWQ